MGYTGLEGLLNYVYYQPGALNQFDEVSHLLHFSIFEVGSGPCEAFNPGPEVPRFDATGPPGSPGYTTTTNFEEAHRCVAWLGESQPGINPPNEALGVPPYHPSVCPNGSTDPEICDPSGSARTAPSSRNAAVSASGGGDPATDDAEDAGTGTDGADSGIPGIPDVDDITGGGGGTGGSTDGGGGLDDVLDLPGADTGGRLPNLRRSGTDPEATRDLLGFLFED
jgi:hypothetical protein